MVLKLIPRVKQLTLSGGSLPCKAVCIRNASCDVRILNALQKLPIADRGVPVTVEISGGTGEGYTLSIRRDEIIIAAERDAGAVYAVQTLRQIFNHDEVPCLEIRDEPDVSYRGFYHDVTRGKIPKVETIKNLIDQMAYYKLNSLQLYVEHVYEFAEYRDVIAKTGCLTKEELLEIGAYCRDHFVEFIPSLSTFGHLYELLQQEQYQHLRVQKDYEYDPNFWCARMRHHTIDPLQSQSFEVIKSLIDQYMPLFESDTFNICCDETFDLRLFEGTEHDPGRLYVDFVKKLIAYLQSKGKKIMMWADILLKHPEVIEELPEDICFLNWNYRAQPPEENFRRFADLHRRQIVCPGTTTWNRLCERVEVEEPNICKMAEFAKEYGAEGILNTNWGDWGNPCSVELAMYGLVLGAEKSWSVDTPVDDCFYDAVNSLLYGKENGIQLLKELSAFHSTIGWCALIRSRFGTPMEGYPILRASIAEVHESYSGLVQKLSAGEWKNDEFRQEMLLCAEGVCVIAELGAKLEQGWTGKRLTDTEQWLKKYRARWMQKNKESELPLLETVFRAVESMK